MEGNVNCNIGTPTLSLIYMMLVTYLLPADTTSTGGANLTINWHYHNPDSTLENGRTCDTFGDTRCDLFIEFCMRESFPTHPQKANNCQNMKHTTAIVDNVDQWSSSIVRDNIQAPVATHYTLEATVYDSDVFGYKQKIGEFIASNFELRPTLDFTTIRLKRKTNAFANPRMRLTVEAYLKCHTDFYGDHCDKHCRKTSKSTCNRQGDMICFPGFQGDTCDVEDACYFEPCVKNAECINRNDRPGRICLCNGGEGPECYPGYDPCQRNPCENNGTCSHTGKFNASFVCNCTVGWAGHRCTDKLTACKDAERQLIATEQLKDTQQADSGKAADALNASAFPVAVCLNGGTCYDHADKFDYRCVCLPGWSGERCEAGVLPFTTAHLTLYMLSIAIPFCVALLIIIVILAYRYRRSKQVLRYMSKAGGIVYFSRDNDSVSINNGKDYQTQYIDHIYKDMKAGSNKFTANSTSRTGSEHNTDSEVYDECNPPGIDSGSNVYGTIFDVDQPPPSVDRAPSVSSCQRVAPPLPKRSYPLSASPSLYGQTPFGSAVDPNIYRSARRLDLALPSDYGTGSRTSRIYLPKSPPAFFPGSALDRIESSPNNNIHSAQVHNAFFP